MKISRILWIKIFSLYFWEMAQLPELTKAQESLTYANIFLLNFTSSVLFMS